MGKVGRRAYSFLLLDVAREFYFFSWLSVACLRLAPVLVAEWIVGAMTLVIHFLARSPSQF